MTARGRTAHRPAPPPGSRQCTGCAGGGKVNEVECRECKGNGWLGVRPPARRRWRKAARSKPALAAATGAGTVVRAIPGIGGAAAVTTGAAAIAHAIWHPLPALGVAAAVGGVFLLLLDAKL